MRFYTVNCTASSTYHSQGSKFIAFIHQTQSLEKYKSILNDYKTKHPRPCHVCSAYRLYSNNQIIEYSSDDGEPRGSSGPPVLNKIKKHNMVNVSIYVVRYFGGKKLGISGLINAYGSVSDNCLKDVKKILWFTTKTISIRYNYLFSGFVENLITKFKAKIIKQEFDKNIVIKIQIREELEFDFKKHIYDKSNGKIIISS